MLISSEFRKRCLAVGFSPWRLVDGTAARQATTAAAAAAATAVLVPGGAFWAAAAAAGELFGRLKKVEKVGKKTFSRNSEGR